MSKEEREEKIAWLMITEGCSKKFWDKQSDEQIEQDYRASVLDDVSG